MYNIGVDLGGTTIKAGIVNTDGEILLKKSVETLSERDNNEILQSIADLVLHLISEAKLSKSDINYVGIGTPGSVDIDNGIVINAYNLGFSNLKIRQILSSMLEMQIYVENDANCACYAEYYAGEAKGYNSALLLTIGTGIGGGLIIDGKSVNGSFFGGGEFGHMVINSGGEQCSCGRKGCLETYCSSKNLTDICIEKAKNDINSVLYKLSDGDVNSITPKTLFKAKDEDCSLALEILEEYNQHLSDGIANFINIFEPEIVLIGGGISIQGEKLLKEVRQLTHEKCFNKNSKVVIKIAKHFNDAGIIGASFIGMA